MAFGRGANRRESGGSSAMEKGFAEQREHVAIEQRPRGSRLGRHCARRWWLYLIVFLLVALGIIIGL
jgi:hypothetical protein